MCIFVGGNMEGAEDSVADSKLQGPWFNPEPDLLFVWSFNFSLCVHIFW